MSKRTWWFVLAALGVAVILGGLLSPFASSSPDGLEKVAEDKGFLEKGESAPAWRWPLIPDYALPGVSNESLATGMAGVAGTLLVFGLGYGLTRLLARRTQE
jgi:cobalt/nickel transport protein